MTNPPKPPAEWADELQRQWLALSKLSADSETLGGSLSLEECNQINERLFTECAAQARREALEDAAKVLDVSSNHMNEASNNADNEASFISMANVFRFEAKKIRALAEKEK